ncbi:MAG TPA: 30S ribosomal protein S16 [Candidatus Atribacteria bacterium]|nr:30S ribosomal protein S16 [Candidatus Atribacteria bacterium]
MSVKIRLTRMGAKKRPFYRIVAVDSRAPRDGKYLDLIGYYDPIGASPEEIKINEEKLRYWIDKGAHLSDTAKNLLKRAKISI